VDFVELCARPDVDDADFIALARDVEPPGRLAVYEDDVERRAR
jgi:hypothetical protein